MVINEKQKAELLLVVKGVLSGAEWAPGEAWLEEGQNGKKPSSPLLANLVCDCISLDPRPPSLTLFLKAPLSGQHFNLLGKLEGAVRRWASSNLKVEGCGICNSSLEVDIRLFRTDFNFPRFPSPKESVEDGGGLISSFPQLKVREDQTPFWKLRSF